MYKFATVVLIVLSASCAPHKYHYFFEPVEPPTTDIPTYSTKANQVNPIAGNDVSNRSIELVIYEKQSAIIEAGIVSQNDTVPRPAQDSSSHARSTKEANKKAFREKKKAYHEAKKVYRQQRFIDWPDKATKKVAVKKAHDEMERAYAEARKAYGATKNKRFNGFAIAGAALFLVGFFCLTYPQTALVFAILGFVTSVLGLKSRIWGLSVASLITAAVIISFYIFMSIVLGESYT
jgi:hypothetical protein